MNRRNECRAFRFLKGFVKRIFGNRRDHTEPRLFNLCSTSNIIIISKITIKKEFEKNLELNEYL
jgi:hypothetical protein